MRLLTWINTDASCADFIAVQAAARLSVSGSAVPTVRTRLTWQRSQIE